MNKENKTQIANQLKIIEYAKKERDFWVNGTEKWITENENVSEQYHILIHLIAQLLLEE